MGRYSVFSTFAILSILSQLANAQVGSETGLWKWTEKLPHHDSVVEVLTSSGNGAGVVIFIDTSKPFKGGYEGYILTAWHVIQNDITSGKIKVGYRNHELRSKGCKVIDHDQEKDVALVWAWIPEGIQSAKMATAPIQPGNTLEFAGLGGGTDLKGCIRHFSAVASSPSGIEKIFADVPLLPGDSGGPVFNEKHEVVGIISGGWFWFDSGAKTLTDSKIPTTWPARACNVGAIKQMTGKISVGTPDEKSVLDLAKTDETSSITR